MAVVDVIDPVVIHISNQRQKSGWEMRIPSVARPEAPAFPAGRWLNVRRLLATAPVAAAAPGGGARPATMAAMANTTPVSVEKWAAKNPNGRRIWWKVWVCVWQTPVRLLRFFPTFFVALRWLRRAGPPVDSHSSRAAGASWFRLSSQSADQSVSRFVFDKRFLLVA
jgi:hypothetical protein